MLAAGMPNAKLTFEPVVAEWRNWQTHQTQNLAKFTLRVGSTPTSATKKTKGLPSKMPPKKRPSIFTGSIFGSISASLVAYRSRGSRRFATGPALAPSVQFRPCVLHILEAYDVVSLQH